MDCSHARERAHPDYAKRNRVATLKHEYGLTLEDYGALVFQQNGLCKSCGYLDHNLVVDHNHTTGQVRGLLCNQCNTALGLLKEDPKRMQDILKYLLSVSL